MKKIILIIRLLNYYTKLNPEYGLVIKLWRA
jgi:hypothetical protein